VAGVGNVLLLGLLPSRESDDRLEAKIDRLLSEAIDPAQFDDREEEVQGWGLNSRPTLSACRATSAAR
jgi:hypothetical protein